MKKIIIVFGIIAGLVTSGWLVVYTGLEPSIDSEKGMFYGYASMILAFSLIFVAVKSYRDKHNGGQISFGKAFRIGLFITLIASTIYVLVWQITYFNFIPDFADRYAENMIGKMKAAGASEAEISQKTTEMNSFKKMYDNPLFNALITYTEILPVGLLISLICALILKRRQAV